MDDIRLEFCEATLQALANHNMIGYVVVADLKELPFRNDTFDLAWSFSVIQHTHKDRLLNCIKEIYRILKPGGFTKLEFPNKEGLRNKMGPAKQVATTGDDYYSWDVRYYTVQEYKDIFVKQFNNFKYTVHSFLGIGVLREDLRYVSMKNKLLCSISLALTSMAKIISPLKSKADSIYIESRKNEGNNNKNSISSFLEAHHKQPGVNLNIVHLLQCPVSGSALTLSKNSDFLINESQSLKYPVINNIPILIRSQAILMQTV